MSSLNAHFTLYAPAFANTTVPANQPGTLDAIRSVPATEPGTLDLIRSAYGLDMSSAPGWNDTAAGGGYDPDYMASIARKTAYIVSGTLLSLLTFFGNVLVVMAFVTDRKLHKTSNYYIISLAAADMLVGFVSIPFFTVYMASDLTWPLGHVTCNVWLMMDYALCYTSLLSIFLICIDRYWSVSNSVHYLNNFNQKTAIMLILPTWLFPLALFFVLVWLYPVVFPDTPPVPWNDCYVPYIANVPLSVAIAVVSFWIPLAIILVLYAQVYVIARRLSKRGSRHTHPHSHVTKPRGSSRRRLTWDSLRQLLSRRGSAQQPEVATLPLNGTTNGGTNRPAPRSQAQNSGAKHMKALKMLSTILACYVICWAPFSSIVMIQSKCGFECVSLSLYYVSYGLCYINSTVNPFCYAYANLDFRQVVLSKFRLRRRPGRRTSQP